MPRKVYKSSSVFTSESPEPFAGVIIVEDDGIAYVGPEDGAPIQEGDSIEDLGDRTVTPGLIDCHAHAFATVKSIVLNSCFLSPLFTQDELIEAMGKFLRENPLPETGIYCFYDYDYDTSGLITRSKLDELFGEDTPIMLADYTMHGAAFSTKALEVLEDDGVLPEGSDAWYEEDGRVGYWMQEAFFQLLNKTMNRVNGDDLDNKTIDTIQEMFNSQGITMVGDMRPLGKSSTYIWPEETYLKREKEGTLTLRTGVCSSLMAGKEHWLREKEALKGDYVFFHALKGFMDGGYMNYTAWTSGEWQEGPQKGVPSGPINDMEAYAKNIKEANDLGIAVRLHAEGDLAVDHAVEMFGLSENKDVMNSVEHATTMTDHTLDLIRKHVEDGRKIALNIQTSFLYNEAPTDEKPATVGNEFYNKVFIRTRSGMETGANVTVGSTDYPCTPLGTAAQIRSAVNRLSDVEDSVYYGIGYTPDECITLAQALTGFTKNAALTLGRGHDLGVLKEGYKADITIFDQDLFALAPDEYKNIDIYKTIVGGKEVYTK